MEELEAFRLSIAGAAVPDPEKEWDGSRAFATIDKRIVSLPGVERVMEEAEQSLHDYVSSLFAAFRPVLRAFWEGNDADAARHLVELGERQEQAGRLRKARQCFETALSLSLPLPNKQPQIIALRRIARVAQALGDLRESVRYYQRAAELASDAGDLLDEVIARTGVGNVLAMQGRWSESEEWYRNALRRVTSLRDETLYLERAQLYNNLAMIAMRQDRLPDAEQWFEKAFAAWEVIDSPVDLAICHHNRGLLYRKRGRTEDAREMFGRALQLAIPSALRAAIALDFAESCLTDGLLSQAEEWGRDAEEHAIAARSPYTLGNLYLSLGNLALARGDEDGIIFYEKALEIARDKEYLLLEGETLVNYALLRIELGGREEAQSYLERACEIFAAMGDVGERERAQSILRDLARSVPAEAAVN
ncbi:MAG TPA: tetratricopeptide repeat protein [Longimicrobiaceae bacterium]|nr:tetratricopeptide repeat protein [Longimicrobiaceae bacterium]